MYKFGGIFAAFTGKDPASCNDLMEVERLAEQALQHPLALKAYNSSFVEEHGNVFNVTDYAQDLDGDIDRQISKMSKVCKR